jgi:hypothetical protein
MPLAFSMGTRITVAGTVISDVAENTYTCRDAGYHQLTDSFYSPAFSRLVQTRMPDKLFEIHKINAHAKSSGGWFESAGYTDPNSAETRRLLLIGTLMRNQHLVNIHTTLRIRSLNEQQIRRVVSKLQKKWRIGYAIEEIARGGLGSDRNNMEARLVLSGGIEVLPAWWWSVLFMRSTVEIPEWRDATTLLSKITRADSIGSASLADIRECWRAVLEHRSPAPLAYVVCRTGPVGVRSSLAQYYTSIRNVHENWQKYTVDLTPDAQRPPLVTYEAPKIEKKKRVAGETVQAASAPVTVTDDDTDDGEDWGDNDD